MVVKGAPFPPLLHLHLGSDCDGNDTLHWSLARSMYHTL